MNISISRSLRYAAALSFLLVGSALLGSASAMATPPAPKPTLDTPVLSFPSTTQTTIDIDVTAGASGAPYGFVIQWMTQADYIANGNKFSDTACAAGFSGQASGSRYALGSGASVTVTDGNFVVDNGFSTDAGCGVPLVCGTAYVFRVFAQGGSAWMKSDFSGGYVASTAACSTGCTLTQGYWKTHGPIPVGNNQDTWPVDSLMLGTNTYDGLELLSILDEPVLGNGLVSLAQHVIAAKLSIANGADATPVASTIADADALIGSLVVPPVGDGFVDPSMSDPLTSVVDAWLNDNECDSSGG